MSVYQSVLPDLVEHLTSFHDECAIVLIGSVAGGQERPDSDLDLNLFFPDDDDTYLASPYIDSGNRWQLSMKPTFHGIRIDVAWETYGGLKERLEGDGPIHCWPFSNGKILHDPSGAIEPCMAVARRWFREHADVAQRIEAEYTEAKRQQAQMRGTST